jgi:uncharacterized protein (TIGR03437 family)
MRPTLTLVAWFVLAPLVFAATGVTIVDDLPFRFEANQGQADPSIRFIARGQGYNLGLTATGSALSLFDRSHGRSALVRTRIVGGNPSPILEAIDRQSTETNYIRGNDPAKWLRNVPSWSRVKYARVYPGIDVVFYGSDKRLEYDFNVLPGADPSTIELEFSGARRMSLDRLGDLVLETDAGEIRWETPLIYQRHGAERRPVAGSFALRASNRVGFTIGAYERTRELVIDPTLAYATYLGGSKNDGAASIAIDSAGAAYICGFTGSDDFPNTGGSFQPAYAGGAMLLPAFHGDGFVAKIDPTGSHVVYNTYLGGRADDFALGIGVDSAGEAIVTGYTTSSNFPVTPNGYSGKYNGAGGNQHSVTGDAFLTKLNAAGNGLVYSTYFGGSQDDAALALAVDSTGAAFLTGITLSKNFPITPGALQSSFKGSGGNIAPDRGAGPLSPPTPMAVTGDAFVAKFSPAGALVFSTYLGGSLDDIGAAIALDSSGNIYVTGATLSSDFPVTPGDFQNTSHGTDKNAQYILITGDAFVTKIDPTGTKLLYSTYLGGSRDEMGLAIAVDATGAAFVTGFTTSTNFPTTAGAYSRTYKGPPTISPLLNFNSGDVFVTKLNPVGSQLVFSTLVGGVNDDGGSGIALDPMGNIYVSGFTNSGEFPTTSDALQRTFPGMVYVEPSDLTKVFAAPAPIGHGFLFKMPPDGSSILYSTFLGGTGNDRGATRVVLDNAGNAYLTGLTGSANFPVTPNAMQRVFGGSMGLNDPKGDAWMAKISGLFPPIAPPPPVIPPITISTIANAASYAQGAVAPGEIIVVSGAGMGPAAQITGAPDPVTGLLATTLGGAKALFDGVAAPLVNASATQLTVIVPYEVDGKSSTQMQVSFNGQTSTPTTVMVGPSSPGLFSTDSSGAGQALALNADSSPNSAANPANTGDVVTLNGTGEGQTIPPGVDGQIANDTLPQPVLPLSVTIGGQPAQVSSYGAAPGQPAGYLQISVQVPDGLSAGDQPVVVTVGSASSPPNLTVAVSGTPPSASPKKRKPRARVQ